MDYRTTKQGDSVSTIGIGGTDTQMDFCMFSVNPAYAGNCIGCGSCETSCPFHVAVREKMKKVDQVMAL